MLPRGTLRYEDLVRSGSRSEWEQQPQHGKPSVLIDTLDYKLH
jgi:hypothetical protein